MLGFVKNYSLINIRRKMIFLYMLNVSDLILTIYLLNTGYFQELNIIMFRIMEDPINIFLFKISLPILLLNYLYFRMKNASERQLKISNSLLNGITIAYCFVNISHLIWILFYLFFI